MWKSTKMSEKPRFNDQEYISIRTEMIERISLINSQSHTTILTITTAWISFVFYIIFAFLSLGNINKYTKEYFNVFLIFFSLIGIVCVIAIALIRKSSGMKNTLMKSTPIYVQGYIKRALELGFIKEKDIEHVKKELNPYKEMYILV